MKQAISFHDDKDRFLEVESSGKSIVVCDRYTKVMYAATILSHYGEILITSVLVDADGKPLLYEGVL